MVKTKNLRLTKEENSVSAEQRYWDQVDQQAHYLVADLLNQSLPLPNLRDKKNLALEKDADYRNLLFEYENNYSERANSLSFEVLSEEIAYEYLLLVVKSLLSKLSRFNCHLGFEELNLTN